MKKAIIDSVLKFVEYRQYEFLSDSPFFPITTIGVTPIKTTSKKALPIAKPGNATTAAASNLHDLESDAVFHMLDKKNKETVLVMLIVDTNKSVLTINQDSTAAHVFKTVSDAYYEKRKYSHILLLYRFERYDIVRKFKGTPIECVNLEVIIPRAPFNISMKGVAPYIVDQDSSEYSQLLHIHGTKNFPVLAFDDPMAIWMNSDVGEVVCMSNSPSFASGIESNYYLVKQIAASLKERPASRVYIEMSSVVKRRKKNQDSSAVIIVDDDGDDDANDEEEEDVEEDNEEDDIGSDVIDDDLDVEFGDDYE